MNKNIFTNVLLISLLGIFFFFPFLGAVHLFDWDEINFAEAAREMILTGNYSRVQINYEIFTEKPPLFFWMQAISMKIFGINEFAARFPNAVCGVFTLITLFLIGNKIKNANFGWLWVLGYLGSFLPHLYFKSGIIDPFFNLFIFLAIYFIINTIDNYKITGVWKYSAFAGMFIGLAILTKGPVGLLIPLLAIFVYWVSVRRSIVSIGNFLICALSAILIASLWFGVETYKNGFKFILEFTERQIAIFSTSDAGHGQPWYYHPIVLFIGCFPISIIALRTFIYYNTDDKELLKYRKWMLILFWVVLILFSIVKTKIVHYSSMCYFPISFLAAYHLHYIIEKTINLNRLTIILLLFIGFVLSFALTALPLIGMNSEKIIPYIDDPFAVSNLQANVYWSGWEILIGIIYFLLILLSIFLITTQSKQKGIYILFFSTAFCMLLYTRLVVPKIELYTQSAAIKFYQSLQGKDVYVNTLGFKSYAQLYYFNKPTIINKLSYDEQWLLTGPIDKDAYFVSKIQDKKEYLQKYPLLKEIKEENGFVFFIRKI